MKYLKHFDAKEYKFIKLLDQSMIKYILMDLTDIGYKVGIEYFELKKKYMIILTNTKGINKEEVKDSIDHLSNYMKSEGYILSSSDSNNPFKSGAYINHKANKMIIEYTFSPLALLKSKKKD